MNDDQFQELSERVADFEMLLISRALTKKLGQLTDKEMDRTMDECQLTIAHTATKVIKTVEHNFTRLITFTETWAGDELMVKVESAYGKLASSSELAEYLGGRSEEDGQTKTFH